MRFCQSGHRSRPPPRVLVYVSVNLSYVFSPPQSSYGTPPCRSLQEGEAAAASLGKNEVISPGPQAEL